MANRNKGRGARSRKRRPSSTPAKRAPAAAPAAGGEDGESGSSSGRVSRARDSSPTRPKSARTRRRGAAAGGTGGLSDLLAVGDRPQAPWHPLPLSELLILVGAIGVVVGLSRGVSNGGAPLFAGLAAVALGTVEVTVREHLSGYRSHTIMLALMPTLLFDAAVFLIVAAFTTPVPSALKVAVLALDLPLFVLLFKLLRARFQDARRGRIFAARQ